MHLEATKRFIEQPERLNEGICCRICEIGIGEYNTPRNTRIKTIASSVKGMRQGAQAIVDLIMMCHMEKVNYFPKQSDLGKASAKILETLPIQDNLNNLLQLKTFPDEDDKVELLIKDILDSLRYWDFAKAGVAKWVNHTLEERGHGKNVIPWDSSLRFEGRDLNSYPTESSSWDRRLR